MSSSTPKRIILFVVLLIALGMGGYYFGNGRYFNKPPVTPPAPPPPAVTILEIKPGDVPLAFEYAGRTAGSREVEIRARVDGILAHRMYVEGAAVKQGDVLFKIDPATYASVQAGATALFNQASADWQRAQQLFKEKALSARERDQAQSNFEQARAASQTARINLDYTTVTAPISGVTSQEGLSEGSLVQENTSLLTKISQLDPIYVNFSAPDSEILAQRRLVTMGKIKMPEDGKLKAELRFGDGDTYGREGVIDFTDSMIDTQTGTVRLRAVVPNGGSAILPGQFVRVVVKGFVKPNAVAIPDQAVMQGPQGQFVYVIGDGSKATIRPVTLGTLNGTTRIIESGLNAGDKIITEGMIKVRPDTVVTTSNTSDPNGTVGTNVPKPEMVSTDKMPDNKTDADTKDAGADNAAPTDKKE